VVIKQKMRFYPKANPEEWLQVAGYWLQDCPHNLP
jgi:hypothetical protein